MIKLLDLLKESAYPFIEHDVLYDDEDNSLLVVEYTFKTEKNKYKVVFNSKERAREFEVSFGIDTGDLNKIDTFQTTGEGNALKILSTVADIINSFLQTFSKDYDKIVIDGTTDKRRSVYRKFFPNKIDTEYLDKVIIK